MSVLCPTCGEETPAGFPRCANCGAPLGEVAATREERKVVTVLFCDLVGFTARAERLDPEDVRRVLQPYHQRVRAELERFGGTVEKFIGDAVMAVFGAPVAHEDDPERAVRAAIAIREALVEEGELEVRIGITTGEALVSLDARPDAGEGMASGDVVNTAARLQAAASTNGILVDETTFRATERVIEYGPATTIEAKGKADPIPVWEAHGARSRVAVERVGGASLVGREQELRLLREALGRAIREGEPQLVTLVGVPGIGKSRLVYELFRAIETGDHGLVYWRHGRSLPYGDGVTFWALGEIVKAQAGILESDSAEQASDKLHDAVSRFVEDEGDAAWLERRLRPLAGLETDEEAGDRREESFAAWRRYLEAIADERPLVLVFEDLHWADDVLLDFVDYLVEWASGVPLLVLATARPELLTRRPGWGGGKVNSSTLLLSALTDEETATLVHELLGSSVVDADLQVRLLEHAEGNPLYAEEFTRMVSERPAEVSLPETIHGIVAARLDTLPPEEKALLQDAAVLGRTFWLGALDGERCALEARLHSLARKEFVSRSRRSSVAGEDEYSFRHALVRDVAYEQVPRAARAGKHIASAAWIESLGRSDDHAEMLAHHYTAALDAARASAQDIAPFAGRAGRTLREAGDRALALNAFAAAARYYELAVELVRDDDAERPELLFGLARARQLSTDDRGEEALVEARRALQEAERAERVAEVDALLAENAWYQNDRERCDRLLEQARSTVDPLPASAPKAHVLSQVSRYRMLAGDFDESVRVGQEALAMAERLGLDELRAHALINIGVSRASRGDAAGIELLEQGVELALAIRSPEATRGLNNLGAVHATVGDFRRSGMFFAEAVRVGEELGCAPTLTRFARAQLTGNHLWTGKWDEGLRLAEICIAESAGDPTVVVNVRRNRARVLLARDEVERAVEDISIALEGFRAPSDPQFRIPALGAAAHIFLELGRHDEARALASEFLDVWAGSPDWRVVDFVFAAGPLGFADAAIGLLAQLPPSPWLEANLALARGDEAQAALLYDEIGVPFVAADARLLGAQRLWAEGRGSETKQLLDEALAFYRPAAATRYVRRAEQLLADAGLEVSA